MSNPLLMLRLLLAAVVVPCAFAWFDNWLLTQIEANRNIEIEWVLITFVVQIAVFGLLCAKAIDKPLLRWLTYGWCWLMVDLQLYSVGPLSGYYDGGSVLVGSLLCSQLCLVVVWGVLGTTAASIRLPIALGLGALLGWLLLDQRDFRFVMQAVMAAVICIGIAWQGFRLVDLSNAAASDDASPAAQFGLQHALAWMTAFSVLLAIVRGMLTFNRNWQHVRSLEWVAMLSTGALLGMVLIVALWAALGRGRVWIRLPLLLVVGFVSGCVSVVLYQIGMTGWEFFLNEPYLSLNYWEYVLDRNSWRGGRDNLNQYLFCGCFTFSALLLMRLLGYRLARPARARPNGSG
jgi:hypothetical protein